MKFKEIMKWVHGYQNYIELRTFLVINEGDIISGTVIGVSEEEVILDLNYYTQGVIKAADLSDDPDFSIFNVQVGDVMEATVVRRDDGHGSLLLSRKEAKDVLAWDVLKDMMEKETVALVKIKEAVKGGVVTYLEDIRAFIPASQIAADYVENPEYYVGMSIEVNVITVDPEKERLVLSGKKVARQREVEKRNHKISMMVPGTILEGTIETIKPYGAFVSIGNGLSGLLHISQISTKRIKSPHEVLKEGQKVKVKVLNTNDGKIALSMRALEEDAKADENAGMAEEIEKYSSREKTGISLADLLAGFKF